MIRKLFAILIPISLLGSAFAQAPSWGFGPAITVFPNGNVQNCQATDYFLHQVKSYNITGVSTLTNSEGIVAWTNGTNLGALTYDTKISDWKTTTINNFTGLDFTLTGRTLSWKSNNLLAGAAIYDAILSEWKRMDFPFSINFMQRNGGTVAGSNSTLNKVAFTTYDPVLGNWQTYVGETGPLPIMTIAKDFGTWRSSDYTIGYAFYDRILHQWVSGTETIPSTNFIAVNGIVASSSSNNSILVSAFDIEDHTWVDSIFVSPTHLMQIGITNGTVYFENSTGVFHLGYDHLSNVWQEGVLSRSQCQNLFWQPYPNDTKVLYLNNHLIGSSFDHYSCGDGHNVTMPSTFKQYEFPDYYLIQTNVDLGLVVGCGEYVPMINPLQTMDGDETLAQLFPNPCEAGATVHLVSKEPMQSIRILNDLGQTVHQNIVHGSEMDFRLPQDLGKGIYIAEIQIQRGQIWREKVIVY